VAVKVNDESDLSLFADLLNESLYGYYLRTILILLSDIPVSIEIFPSQISAVVTEHNPIRIHHWNDIDDIIFQ
jgi:hypothetical protein